MLEPSSLYRLQFASDPQVSRDGRLAAAVVTRIEDDPGPGGKAYRASVWLSRDGEAAAPFTAGTAMDTSPRFSPDGARLAFLSTRGGGKPQLFAARLDGGEPARLTSLAQGVSAPAWSPDGRSIAFLSRGEEPDAPDDGRPKVVEDVRYKADQLPGRGFFPPGRLGLWVVPAEGGRARAVGAHPTNLGAFAWLPDGSGFVFVAPRDRRAFELWNADLFVQPLAGGPSRRLTDWNLPLGDSVAVSDDGMRAAVFAADRADRPSDRHVWALDLTPEVLAGREAGSLRRLDTDLDRPAGNSVGGDAHHGAYPAGPAWQADGSLLAAYTSEAAGRVLRLRPDEVAAPLLSFDEGDVSAFAASPTGVVAYLRGSSSTLDELHVRSADGVTRRLTHLSESALAGLDVGGRIEHVRLDRDGFVVEGWLLSPAGWREGESYPLVLEIHGGPHTAYGHTYLHEFQLLAARGYAVLFGNIRGSTGYGEAQTLATYGEYLAGDFDDLMALLDETLERFGWLDRERLGVIGGSYGGLMVNWITTRTERFRAAVTDRSICNWISFAGTSDIGYRFTPLEHGRRPPEDAEYLWDRSPLKYADRVRTPTLIVHSEEDHRCPIEQAEQWFVALREHGVEVRFVRFPGEGHELSRSGRPDRRVARLTELLGWFDRFLK